MFYFARCSLFGDARSGVHAPGLRPLYAPS